LHHRIEPRESQSIQVQIGALETCKKGCSIEPVAPDDELLGIEPRLAKGACQPLMQYSIEISALMPKEQERAAAQASGDGRPNRIVPGAIFKGGASTDQQGCVSRNAEV